MNASIDPPPKRISSGSAQQAIAATIIHGLSFGSSFCIQLRDEVFQRFRKIVAF